MSFSIPNLLSLARMGLIPLFIVSVVEQEPWWALATFAIAAITDGLDGFIARFLHQKTLLGAYLDPIADKLLLTTAFVVLAIPGLHAGTQIPIWVTVLVIARDVLIVVVALVLYLTANRTSFEPTLLSKLNTAVQLGAVLLVLSSGLLARLETAAIVGVYLVVALTVASGLDYVYRGAKMMEDIAGEEA